MKKRIILLCILLISFGNIWNLAHANDITNAVNSLTNSVKSRFQKPGFDLRNSMLQGDENDTANALLPGSQDVDKKVGLGVSAQDVTLKDNFLGTIQKYLMALVWIVAIAMFIYSGFQLFTARGDEKEYTQARKAFWYSALGLAIIPLSYVLVRIVLWFKF